MTLKNVLLNVFLTTVCLVSADAAVTANPAAEPSPAAPWRHVREVAIKNTADSAADAVVEVQLTPAVFDYTQTRTDGADVRFSATPGALSGAGLPYWIEQWNDQGTSRIWVKVPRLAAQATTKIYLHYGNGAAVSAADGEATFLFFDDFNADNFTNKWTNVSIAEVVEQGGLLKLREADGQEGMITAHFQVTGKMIVHAAYQRERGDGHWTRAGIGGWDHWCCVGDHIEWDASGTNYVMLLDGVSITNRMQVPLIKVTNGKISDQWRRVAYGFDGTQLRGQQDQAVAEWTTPDASSPLALRTLDNDSWDNFAFVAVSPCLNPEPVVTVGAQND